MEPPSTRGSSVTLVHENAGRGRIVRQWALPGGLVMNSEPLKDAALRILHEETAIAPAPGYLPWLPPGSPPGRLGSPKQILRLFSAPAIARLIARCVVPTPVGPRKTTLLLAL